jgi:hypothetical protein
MRISQTGEPPLSRDDNFQLSGKWIARKQDFRTIGIFCFLFCYFIAMGATLAFYASQVKEYVTQYDLVCPVNVTQQYNCTITINVKENMPGPVYFYYYLQNFFQNHRKYYTSKSYNQLAGIAALTDDDVSQCNPIKYNSQSWFGNPYAIDGTPLNPNAVASPCGLIAMTLFNDSFYLYDSTNKFIPFDLSNIAWPEDTASYKAPPNAASTQWTNVTDPHFLVWMRPSGLSYFKKLYGVIPGGLTAGIYTVNVTSNYDMTTYSGKKNAVLATRTDIGGQNLILCIIHFIAALLCLIIVIAVIIHVMYRKKQPSKAMKYMGT